MVFLRESYPQVLHLVHVLGNFLTPAVPPVQHLAYYQQLNLSIKRADFSRYLVVQTFGGLYMDLDVQLRRPVREVRLAPHCYSLCDKSLYFCPTAAVSVAFNPSAVCQLHL